MKFFSSFLLAPDHPDLRNPDNGEPYSVRRFWSDWFTIILTVWLLAYLITNSTIVSILLMLVLPCLAVYQGASGMLYYRYHFGTPPFPQNPAHGVVVVNPEDLNTTTTTTTTTTNNNYHNKQEGKECCQSNRNIKFGMYHKESDGCQCEGGLRWRRGGPLSKKEQEVMDRAFDEEEPIRILVMGDSLALGLGTDRSCMPLLPETLAKSISKRMGGRAVFWTGYGGEGAASSWTLNELSRGRKKKQKRTAFLRSSDKNNHNPMPKISPLDSLSEYTPLTAESSFDDDDKFHKKNNKDDYDTDDDLLIGRIVEKQQKKKTKTYGKSETKTTTVDMFSKWKERLQTFRRGFENDISGPYDYVFIFAGGNDAKAAFIPLYGRTKKGDDHDDDDARKKCLLNDFEHILERLGPKMYNTDLTSKQQEGEDDDDDNNNDNGTTITKETNHNQGKKEKTPLVVFPMMPSRLIPSFQRYPLLWLAIPLIGIIENNKRRLQKKYPSHVVTVDATSTDAAVAYESQQGLLWHRRATEDTLLCLRDVTAEECRSTTKAMQQHVERKSIIHGSSFESRTTTSSSTSSTEVDNNSMINAPQPPLSELAGGGKGYNIVSVDRVHPNDEGYDFWGRHIAEGLFQQLPVTATQSAM